MKQLTKNVLLLFIELLFLFQIITILISIPKHNVPMKSNSNIESTYLKIQGSNITNIIPSNADVVTFRNDTLIDNQQTKEIFSFKLFGLEKLYPIRLQEVHNLKIKGLSGDNYYVTDIKTNIKNNETTNTIKLSHVKSSVLETLDDKADKEIIVSKNLFNLKKDTIVTLSKDNSISTINNVKETTIDYGVKSKTYYEYTIPKVLPLSDPILNIIFILSCIAIIIFVLFKPRQI